MVLGRRLIESGPEDGTDWEGVAGGVPVIVLVMGCVYLYRSGQWSWITI